MVCIYRLGSEWKRFRDDLLLLHWVALGCLAELRGPDGSDEPG